MKKRHPLRYAVIGLGHLSQAAILPAFRHCKRSKLVVMFSDDQKKRAKLAKEYQVPTYGYEELEDILKKEAVDIAYLVVPNTLHREFTERIAAAGVHVLCEKPMATTEEDCTAMIRACHTARVKLMVAYRLHFSPTHLAAVELARSGKLGKLRIFQSTYTMQVKAGNIRTKADLGGGPLFDIGIYSLNAARYLFSAEPVEVFAWTATRSDSRFKEIEEMASAILRFPDNRLASFTCSFGAQDLCEVRLIGTDGLLKMNSAFHYVGPSTWTAVRGERTKKRKFAAEDQFAAEMDYFAKCIQDDVQPEPSGQEGLADVRIISAIHQSAQCNRPIKLPPAHKEKRPRRKQQKRRPPVKRRPSLVKADAPHH